MVFQNVVVRHQHLALSWTLTALAGLASSASGFDDKNVAPVQPPSSSSPATPASSAMPTPAKKDVSNLSATFNAAQPLPTDERLVTGELLNGMKYIVLKHGNPPGRAAMFIHIGTGSLNETEQQRGIAHFLEHMAFNGSENFAPGSVIDFFQSMGLSFGQHQNAFTSFDQTAYQLFFPDVKPETLDKGMLFFADVAGRLLLKIEEIDKERGVILEEKRARLSPQQRIQEFMLPRLFPGATIGERFPIGLESTITGMSHQDFMDYYSKWYVPSNMTVIVVADADPAMVVEHITKTFGTVGKKVERPGNNPIGVQPYDADRAIIATDAEITEATVGITHVSPARQPTTTVGDLRRDLVEEIGQSAFDRRIGDKITKGGTAYTGAFAGSSSLFNAALLAQAQATGEPAKWKEMLAELGQDLQRARLHGFSDQELDDVKKELIASAEQFVEREKSIPARAVIGRINNDVATGEPTMSAQQRLALLQQLLPTITASETGAAFSAMYAPKNVTYVLQLPSSQATSTEAELLALGTRAMSVTPEAMKEEARVAALLTKLPAGGHFGDVTTHEAALVTTASLDNGIVFHHRFMDIRKDTATVTITLAAGSIQETAANRGIADVAALAWDQAATSTLSSKNIRDLMTGKKVNVNGGAGVDTMTLSISGSPSQLEDGFQLAYLLLTDPIIEPSALDQWKVAEKQGIEARKKQPQGVFAEQMAQTIFPASDVRMQPMTVAQVDALTLPAAQAWLKQTIATAPMEVSVVGDIDKDRAMELVGRYLGSLSKRHEINKSLFTAERKLVRDKGPRLAKKIMQTKTPIAIALSGFYGADADNLADARTLQVAAKVLGTRMIQIVREEQQLAYSPSCNSQPGREFPGFGVFVAFSPTAPEKADALTTSVAQIFDSFAKSGPTEEEMTTAKKQFANTFDEQFKEPGYWSQRLGSLVYRGTKLDDVLSAPSFIEGLTASQVQETFAKYYTPDAKIEVVVSAEPKAITEKTGDASKPADEKPMTEKPVPSIK